MSIHCYLNKKNNIHCIIVCSFLKKTTCFIGTCFNFNEFNMLKKLIKEIQVHTGKLYHYPFKGPHNCLK